MRYGEIKTTDVANGVGVRVSLFVSGCRHCCDGCFNKMTWDFGYGSEYTEKTEDELIAALSKPYIKGITLLGGEPFEPENQQDLLKLLKRVKSEFASKDVWCYSGFTFEQILSQSRATTEISRQLLEHIDVLVDGRFEKEKKNLKLSFRGSENQRIIDVKKSLESGSVILYEIN